MADDDATAGENGRAEDEPVHPSAPQFEIDMHFVDSLPGGRVVMPVEEKGRFGWLVVQGHVTPQARSEMLSDLRHMVRSGLWRQDWQPPASD